MNRHSQSTPLQLNVKTATIQSRGLIESATLPDGSQIGITLAGDVYSEYDNTVFTASTVNGKQQWNSTKEVLLTSEESVLFSYYPWKEGTDYNAIEIETASQTDYLYGTPVESVSEDNANPTITLNHALANINLTFVKGTYVGEGDVTEVSVYGDGIATGGTFDASITQSYIPGEPLTGVGEKVTVTTATELDGDAVNIMVVPVNVSKSFTVTATIDGVDYTVSTSAVQLEMGNSYKYTLTLNSTMMGVSEVAVTQWNPVTKDNLILEKDKSGPVVNSAGKANGVYAVTATGELIAYNDAAVDATCLGVALITDNQKIMIEKMGEANAEWNSNTTLYWGRNLNGKNVAGITEITDQTVAKADFNGLDHTNAIIAAYTEHSVAMDARDMCSVLQTFNDGDNNGGYSDWYIPALGQLYEIYTNRTNINTALSAMTATQLSSDDYYWSSSECSDNYGWNVYFYDGIVYYRTKGNNNLVRFVRDI